jgi:hypothetical protein
MYKLTKLLINFTNTKVNDEGFDKIVGKLKGHDLIHLTLHFGKTKIKKDLGLVNLASVLSNMNNLEKFIMDFY